MAISLYKVIIRDSETCHPCSRFSNYKQMRHAMHLCLKNGLKKPISTAVTMGHNAQGWNWKIYVLKQIIKLQIVHFSNFGRFITLESEPTNSTHRHVCLVPKCLNFVTFLPIFGEMFDRDLKISVPNTNHVSMS